MFQHISLATIRDTILLYPVLPCEVFYRFPYKYRRYRYWQLVASYLTVNFTFFTACFLVVKELNEIICSHKNNFFLFIDDPVLEGFLHSAKHKGSHNGCFPQYNGDKIERSAHSLSSTKQNVIGPIRISHLYRAFFFIYFYSHCKK